MQKNRLRWIGAAIPAALLLIAVIVFWLLSAPDDAMGFSLLFFWILLPLGIFAGGLLIGLSGGARRWLWVLYGGAVLVLAEYVTFSAANMAAFHRFNPPEFVMFLPGAIFCAAGIGIGKLIGNAKK